MSYTNEEAYRLLSRYNITPVDVAELKSKLSETLLMNHIAPNLWHDEISTADIINLVLHQDAEINTLREQVKHVTPKSKGDTISKINVAEKVAKDKKDIAESITFSPFFIGNVLPQLLKYFTSEHYQQLCGLIEKGVEPDVPLQFRGRANQLVEFFKRAKYNDHILCYSNTPLQEWICKFFTRQINKGFAPFKPARVADLLKNEGKEGVMKNHILTKVLPHIPFSERRK